MALRLPPLSALRLFEAAGRHKSFKRAADELAITPSAVSHGIRSLEEWLNLDLFERRSGQLELTAAGSDYLKFVSEALATIATGTQRLPRWRPVRRIIVSCAPTFAERLLLPRLHRFRAQNPGIALSVDTAQRQVNFPVDGVDLAIRRGRSPWLGLSSLRLFFETLVPVCSPAYLQTVRNNDGLADLAAATLLEVTSVAEDWENWLEVAGKHGIDLSKAMQFDTINLALQAAATGLGIAIGRKQLIEAELASGALVPAAEPPIQGATAYWLVGPDTTEGRPDIAAFRSWLVEEFADTGRAAQVMA